MTRTSVERESSLDTSIFMQKRIETIQDSISKTRAPVTRVKKHGKLRPKRESTDISNNRNKTINRLKVEHEALIVAVNEWGEYTNSNPAIVELYRNNPEVASNLEEIFFHRYCIANNIKLTSDPIDALVKAQSALSEDVIALAIGIKQHFTSN